MKKLSLKEMKKVKGGNDCLFGWVPQACMLLDGPYICHLNCRFGSGFGPIYSGGGGPGGGQDPPYIPPGGGY